MSVIFERLLAQYDYTYPESAVALEPAEPRDSARLMVWNAARSEPVFSTFARLGDYLPSHSVLVLNETKVIPARIECVKPTGGKVRILFVEAGVKKGEFRALADRPLAPGMELEVSQTAQDNRPVRVTVIDRDRDGWLMRTTGRPIALFLKYGRTPIPPYLKRTLLGEEALRSKYQTVFAKHLGSVAAPTASLHFTKGLLAGLKRAGHDVVYVTLHVNLGTFAPLTPEAFSEGRLHEERYEISPSAKAFLERAKREGRAIIPVGTTALRALESAAEQNGRLARPEGATRLFIRPGYKFAFAGGLITNFHVPKSSLLMLVAALVKRTRLLKLYRAALAKGFKIFSFGDGMLLLPRGQMSAARRIQTVRKKTR